MPLYFLHAARCWLVFAWHNSAIMVGELRNVDFRLGRPYGWVDYVDSSAAFAHHVAEAMSGTLLPDGKRSLVVEPWTNNTSESAKATGKSKVPVADRDWIPVVGAVVWGQYTADDHWYEAEVDQLIRVGRSLPGLLLPVHVPAFYTRYHVLHEFEFPDCR